MTAQPVLAAKFQNFLHSIFFLTTGNFCGRPRLELSIEFRSRQPRLLYLSRPPCTLTSNLSSRLLLLIW